MKTWKRAPLLSSVMCELREVWFWLKIIRVSHLRSLRVQSHKFLEHTGHSDDQSHWAYSGTGLRGHRTRSWWTPEDRNYKLEEKNGAKVWSHWTITYGNIFANWILYILREISSSLAAKCSIMFTSYFHICVCPLCWAGTGFPLKTAANSG